MRNLKPVVLPVLFAAAMTLLPTTNAAAHDSGYRDHAHAPVFVHYREQRLRMPRWLRHHRDFRYWYRINHYRFRPDLGWQRLFRRYQRDYYYHRHYNSRHYKDRHYKDWRKGHKRKNKNRHKRHKRDRRDDRY